MHSDDLNRAYYDRAAILPGRSSTRSKAPGKFYALDAGPLYALNGYESTLVDVEGKPYIDMLCALGAISLGYRGGKHWGPGVFSLPHVLEVEAAEMVLQHISPWASFVRFQKTGSESLHAAYRIAKRATGRSKICVGTWSYHGWTEPFDDPTFPWTSRFAHGELPDIRSDTAAVFIEPHRWEPIDWAWLATIREQCTKHGALLVFDSMIYGGRWSLGGTSQFLSIEADLECFGKAYGNGHSVAFLVGRDVLGQYGELQSGTYSGDAVGLSALCETLKVYTSEPVIQTLWSRGQQLADGLRAVCDAFPALQGVVEGQPVHQRIRFQDATMGKLFTAQMASRGVLVHPEVINVMAAHTREQIDQVIAAAHESAAVLNAVVCASV